MRRPLICALLLSSFGLAHVLAACGTTPVGTQSCKNGICTITLKGEGASVRVGSGDGNTLELLGTDGTTARVKVDQNEGTLRTGGLRRQPHDRTEVGGR
jgi:hypothetical protein